MVTIVADAWMGNDFKAGIVGTAYPDGFIRRFLLHTLPDGFHRIRRFGFMANGHRVAKLALCL